MIRVTFHFANFELKVKVKVKVICSSSSSKIRFRNGSRSVEWINFNYDSTCWLVSGLSRHIQLLARGKKKERESSGESWISDRRVNVRKASADFIAACCWSICPIPQSHCTEQTHIHTYTLTISSWSNSSSSNKQQQQLQPWFHLCSQVDQKEDTEVTSFSLRFCQLLLDPLALHWTGPQADVAFSLLFFLFTF